ncbi:helix-turn-helix domain-containing protein [Enterococcus cecorum]|uniref:helix-turn-helix domain-containing protein n=1 Tax=Enterococcus cecorum TaxID=44008 RepID=UPI003F24EE8C
MLLDRVDGLINEHSMTRAELERKTGLSAGSIRNWNKSIPSVDKLNKVADFFGVSVDYLIGRTEKRRYYDLTKKDERNIQKELQSLIDDLSSADGMAFSKEDGEMSESTKEALILSLENALRISKIEAKKKFTPKKYRD